MPLAHLTTPPRESHHVLSQSSHDNNSPASQAVFKALIHEFSSPRHSNASRYLTRSEWHDTTTLDSNLAAEPVDVVPEEKGDDVGTPRPRLALSPHQLLSEMRSGEPDSGHRMLMARAGSEREKNMLLV